MLLLRVIFRSPRPRKPPLNAVGEGGHQVEQGNEPQKADAQLHDAGVIHEEAGDGLRAEEAEDRDADGVNGFDLQTTEKARPHPVLLPAPRFWAIRVVVAWPMFCWGGVGKVVDAAGRGKGGHGVDAHSVDDGLDGDLAQLDGGLLHGAGPAVTDGLFSAESCQK